MAPTAAHVRQTRVPSPISGRSHAYSALAATQGQARSGAGRRPARVPADTRTAAARPGRGAVVPHPRLSPALRRRAVITYGPARGSDQPHRRRGRRASPDGRAASARAASAWAASARAGSAWAASAWAARPARRSPGPAAIPRPASAGGRQLARPVRPGAGRDPGRIPAAPADDDLDHRADPGPDSAAGPDARGWPAAPATPGGGVPARVRGDRDDRGGQLRGPGPGPGRPAGAHPAAPRPARSPAPHTPLAVHRRGGRLGSVEAAARKQAGPRLAGPHRGAGQPLSPRCGCAGRRGSACTCGPTRRGTGRCGRPG